MPLDVKTKAEFEAKYCLQPTTLDDGTRVCYTETLGKPETIISFLQSMVDHPLSLVAVIGITIAITVTLTWNLVIRLLLPARWRDRPRRSACCNANVYYTSQENFEIFTCSKCGKPCRLR